MTIKEQIEILQAYERGEKIEVRKLTCDNWYTIAVSDHQFNFYLFEYRIKPNRWRAGKGESYHCIMVTGQTDTMQETNYDFDDMCFAFGNYFKTKEEAEKASKLVKETLSKFHEAND